MESVLQLWEPLHMQRLFLCYIGFEFFLFVKDGKD